MGNGRLSIHLTQTHGSGSDSNDIEASYPIWKCVEPSGTDRGDAGNNRNWICTYEDLKNVLDPDNITASNTDADGIHYVVIGAPH